MIIAVCGYWKHISIMFIALSLFILFTTPSNLGPYLITHIYVILTILLTALGGVLILIPIMLLLFKQHNKSKFEVFLWIVFIVIFNVMGSFITYFVFRDIREIH